MHRLALKRGKLARIPRVNVDERYRLAELPDRNRGGDDQKQVNDRFDEAAFLFFGRDEELIGVLLMNRLSLAWSYHGVLSVNTTVLCNRYATGFTKT